MDFKEIKIQLFFFLILNVCISLYQFEAYSYYSRTAKKNIDSYKEIAHESKKTEDYVILSEWQNSKILFEESKNEWSFKLIIDVVILGFILIKLRKKKNN